MFADDDLQLDKKWQKIFQRDGKHFVFSKVLFLQTHKTPGLFGNGLSKKHAVVDRNQFNVNDTKF